MEKSMRYNEGKCKWHLVDFKALEHLVRVMEYGANKYAPNNWKKGASREEYLDCIMRHLVSVMDGKEFDDESKQHHMGHIMANAMMYMHHFEKTYSKHEVYPCPDYASQKHHL